MIDKIKPAEERIHPMALDDKSVWCNAYFDEVVELRAAYEALENERDELKKSLHDLQERFNGIKFIESELRKENDSLNAEVLRLKNELIESLKDWHDMNVNHEVLQKENAEQAKRIAELEELMNSEEKS